MNAGGLVLAYHGCDIITRDLLVSGRLNELTPSDNEYDWLGSGTYFFQDDYLRAAKFAIASSEQPNKRYTARPIVTPAVVGAVLRVSHWLDMTTQEGHQKYKEGYEALKLAHEAPASPPMPKNTKASKNDEFTIIRKLDRAVIEMVHKIRKKDEPEYVAVRGAFYQGDPLADSSEFRENTHIQIAVRKEEAVVGWFIPRGMSPMLTSEEFILAQNELEAAIAARPRKRASTR